MWWLTFGFIAYMVILPTTYWLLEQSRPRKTAEIIEDLTFIDIMRIKSVELVTGLMFFALGASVGSFLNVVVYRMPRGLSVLLKPSFCPNCTTKIKSQDNLPVLGWLFLQGACRNCKLPISIRYPTVELATGLIFLLFFFVELISGGMNLPVRIINLYKGVVWILLYPKWDLIGLYTIHMLMFSTLLTWALIHKDQQRIPLHSFLFALVFLTLPGIIWPSLYLVNSGFSVDAIPFLDISQRLVLISVLSGGLAGILFSIVYRVISYVVPLHALRDITTHKSFTYSLCIIGATLGWQTLLIDSISIGIISMIITVSLSKKHLIICVPFVVITCALVHHTCWKYVLSWMFPNIV